MKAVMGLKGVTDAFVKARTSARAHFGKPAERTALAIVVKAKARLSAGRGLDSGALRERIGHEYDPVTGVAVAGVRRGSFLVRGRRHDPRKIAHLIENGHGGPHAAGPKPFMRPAAESEREPFATRVREAGAGYERALTNDAVRD